MDLDENWWKCILQASRTFLNQKNPDQTVGKQRFKGHCSGFFPEMFRKFSGIFPEKFRKNSFQYIPSEQPVGPARSQQPGCRHFRDIFQLLDCRPRSNGAKPGVPSRD